VKNIKELLRGAKIEIGRNGMDWKPLVIISSPNLSKTKALAISRVLRKFTKRKPR
jgi:hypothetical protein